MIIDTKRERQIEKIAKHNKECKTEFSNIEIKLIEEMSELTQALLKYEIDQKPVIEETADVIIVLRQLMTLIDLNELDEAIDFKINRTMEKLRLEV